MTPNVNLLIELVGVFTTILAVIGVILNNRKMVACFYLWLASNGLTLLIHLEAGIISLVVRDAIFFFLAIEGIYRWKRR